jgi:hypothetical protein
MLSGAFPGREELRAQIGGRRVAADCGCGCLSLAFDVAPGAPVLPLPWRQEFAARDEAGGAHSFFFHVNEKGVVHCMDHVRWDESTAGRPLIESLRVCELEPAGPTVTNVTPRALTIIEETALRDPEGEGPLVPPNS